MNQLGMSFTVQSYDAYPALGPWSQIADSAYSDLSSDSNKSLKFACYA